MLTTRRRTRGTAPVLVALSAVVLALGAACSGETLPYAGGLMLSIQTDLSPPKDIAAVGLFITSDGRPIFSDTRDVAPNGEVRFPATIAIIGDEARPRAQIKIRAIAFKDNGDVRVLRDILTTIPKGRTALLRAPLLWINEGSGTGSRSQIVGSLSRRDVTGTPDGFTKITSACPDGQTFLEGACGDATVDGDSLPDYQDKDVFGGGSATGEGGRCFDVKTCFASVARLALDRTSCSAPLDGVDVNDPTLNFAVALPASAATGECNDSTCFIPLDKGTGWKPGGAGVVFPAAICARVAAGSALGVARSLGCPTKDQTTPSCGPASSVSTSSVPSGFDAGSGGPDGSIENADFELAQSYGGEPGLSSVAIDQDDVFVTRSLGNPPPAGLVKLSRADVTALKVPAQISVLNGLTTPVGSTIFAGPKTQAAQIAQATFDGKVFLCTPTSSNDCSPFTYAANTRPLLALGDVELYVYAVQTTAPALEAIPFNPPLAPQARVGPASGVTAMLYAENRIFFGLQDGSIQQCTLPCNSPTALSQLSAAPPAGGVVTAMAVDSRLPGQLFVMRVPADGVTVTQGGIFLVAMGGGGEQQLAPASELLVRDVVPLRPPSALAVDTEYVYWSGSYVPPNGARRNFGLVRRKHGLDSAPVEPFDAVTRTNDVPVSGVAVDDGHVFWTYDRNDGALNFAKKKRAF